MNATPPGLDDPATARFAWRRFRRIMAWMTLAGAAASWIAIELVGRSYGTLGWVAIFALIGGVMGSVLMAGALMGLTFLSSGTGHDESVHDFDP